MDNLLYKATQQKRKKIISHPLHSTKILTETNQFIPVIPEVYRPSKFDEGLKIIQYNNVDMNMLEIDQINLLK